MATQSQRGRAGATVAFLLALAAVAFAWYHGRAAEGLDFYQFRAGARVAREASTQNLYSVLTRTNAYRALLRGEANQSPKLRNVAAARTEFEFFSTPFLYATFGVFRSTYERDLFAFRVVSLGAFVAGVLLLARAVAMSWTGAFLVLAYALVLFQPLQSELRVVNVNGLQLFAVGAAAFLARGATRRWWFAGAAVLGMVSAFKPNIALVVPLLLLYRLIVRDRRRFVWELLGAAAGGALAFVIGALWFDSAGAWLQWIEAARQLAGTSLPLESGNVALFAKHSLGATALLLVLLIAALAYGRRDDETVAVIGAGLLVYLLAASLVWLHYAVLALPLAIALLADASKARRALAALALTLVGCDLWTGVLGVTTQKGEAVVLWSGLALLLALTLWRIAGRAPAIR